MIRKILFAAGMIVCTYIFSVSNSGCAQIGMPTGGPKDTLPPVLLAVQPNEGTTNFTGNIIRFTFNEYIDLKEPFNNILFTPLQKRNPVISYNRKTITVRLRDSLDVNTTYLLQFGRAVTDYNEGNPLPGLTYVFSTGNFIDSLKLSGNITVAETGLTDSTMLLLLYKNLDDTAVQKLKPDYITRPDGKGNFLFTNLPPTPFRLYGLKDSDGGKTYNQLTEMFAFHDAVLNPSQNPEPVILFAYEEKKIDKTTPLAPTVKKTTAWKLQTNLVRNKLDLLENLELHFNRKVIRDSSISLMIADSNLVQVPHQLEIDSTEGIVRVLFNKQPEMTYTAIIPENFVHDTTGATLKNDTLLFKTFATDDYGNITLRFNHLNLERKPVLLLIQNDKLIQSIPLTETTWKNPLMTPGVYTLRILYDTNGNGKWDPGNYATKQQPERTVTLNFQLTVRAGWETEHDITL